MALILTLMVRFLSIFAVSCSGFLALFLAHFQVEKCQKFRFFSFGLKTRLIFGRFFSNPRKMENRPYGTENEIQFSFFRINMALFFSNFHKNRIFCNLPNKTTVKQAFFLSLKTQKKFFSFLTVHMCKNSDPIFEFCKIQWIFSRC